MKKFLANAVFSAVCLFILSLVFKDMHFSGLVSALVTGVVLGVVNGVVKPVVKIVSFPLTIITLGLFSFVINALMLLVTAWLVPGFSVGFGTAMVVSILLSLLNALFIKKVK